MKNLSKDEMKKVMGGVEAPQSCRLYYQGSNGMWHYEDGTCSIAVNPGRVTTTQGYCKTPNFPNPTTLESNGGVSKCPGTAIYV